MTLTTAERETYEQMWQFPDYANYSRGELYADLAVSLMGTGRVLDAGTGSGKGAIALRARGCQVVACDLTKGGMVDAAIDIPFVEACLWDDLSPVGYLAHCWDQTFDPARFDWVYCTDVIEHLPPEFVLLAIVRMLAVSKQGLFLSVAFGHDEWGIHIGKELHQTVCSFNWWRDHLRELGEVVEARDLLDRGIFVVRPRRSGA